MSQMPSAMRETMKREDGSNRRRWMSHIRRIEAAAAEFRIEALLPSLAAASQSLRDGALIDVALVGRFKAGKSSFINAIIQRDLMPVGVLPVTAIVTRLSYGERERAIVQYADGRMSEITLADLARFVTEKGNPRNAAGVFMVDVELPSLGAYPGLRFVDTPGLGSVFAHNSKTALDWLPRIGAAFLAVSVDHPFSEEDAELLAELGAHSPAISILLTKADHLSPADLDELRDFVR